MDEPTMDGHDGPCTICTYETTQCGGYKDNFSCTRPDGHEGPHVACGIRRHAISTWSQEPPLIQER